MYSSDEKAQIKKRQTAERVRKYRERKKLEKEQQRAAAVDGEASVPAAPSQQKRKQDDLLREELNEHLINTPFASMMTEQEKIDAFYNMKLAEKRSKTNERVKRCRLNKKIEMATKRVNEAAEFEQVIAAVLPKRLKTEEIAADAEFTKRFDDNEFSYSCSVCDRLWFQRDLRPPPQKSQHTLAAEFPNEDVASFKVCGTCYTSLALEKQNSALKVENIQEESENTQEESVIVSPDINTIIKEEISEDSQCEETPRNCVSSDTDHVKNEETLQGNKTNESEQFMSDSSVALSLLQLAQGRPLERSLKKYKCEVCNKVFTHSSGLSRHKSVHISIKRYQCDICNKSFTFSFALSRHKLIHSGVKKYHCDICNRSFSESGNLSKHKLIHSGIRNFQCHICSKAFTQARDFSRHKVIHSGIKSYRCSMCNKAFTHSSGLSRHKLIHGDIKKHQCDVCNKAFTHLSVLLEHKLIHQWCEKVSV